MIWFLIGLVGAGSVAGFSEGGGRSGSRRQSGRAAARSALRRLEEWLRRRHEIRVLSRSYVKVSAREPLTRWRRSSLQALLLLGPVCAGAGAATLGVSAALVPPTIALIAAIGTATLVVSTLFRTAAAMAVAANVLGGAALLVSRATGMAGPGRGPVAVTLLVLGGLVAVSAVATAEREPPRDVEGIAAQHAHQEPPVPDLAGR